MSAFFWLLFRFLYTCQRHGALKGAGLPLVTKNMHSNECFFCCLIRFLYTCQRHGALKGAGLPLVTKNMRNEAMLFCCFFRFLYVCPKKAGLANARPTYYEVQPATRVTNRLTKSPHHQITNKLQFLDRSCCSTLLNLFHQSLKHTTRTYFYKLFCTIG